MLLGSDPGQLALKVEHLSLSNANIRHTCSLVPVIVCCSLANVSLQFDLSLPMDDDYDDPTVELRPMMSGPGQDGSGR